jgi:hypothetical protein
VRLRNTSRTLRCLTWPVRQLRRIYSHLAPALFRREHKPPAPMPEPLPAAASTQCTEYLVDCLTRVIISMAEPDELEARLRSATHQLRNGLQIYANMQDPAFAGSDAKASGTRLIAEAMSRTIANLQRRRTGKSMPAKSPPQ